MDEDSIPDSAEDDELDAWRAAAKQLLEHAYCDEDAVYDSQ